MKIVGNIWAWVVAVVTLVSCTHNDMPENEKDIPIDVTKRYIHFDTNISSRGTLVTDEYLQGNFAALGYMYRGDWNTAKVLATPNVFGNTPQQVTYNNGIYSYTPIQPWTGNTYSFFAYYPSNNDNIKLFDGETSKTGEPYITYTLPLSAGFSDLVDVMTASYIDTDVNTSPSVLMRMQHRLSCVDVGLRNYYEYDDDNDPNTDKVPVTMEIDSLSVELTNLMHTEAKIFLNSDVQTEYLDNEATTTTFTLVDGSTFTVENGKDNMKFVDNTSLLLFPQTEALTGTSTLTYKKKYGDGNYIMNTETNTEIFRTELDVDFDRPLLEGRRYYIQITFTSDAVSINIVAADEWDELEEDVDYEFE